MGCCASTPSTHEPAAASPPSAPATSVADVKLEIPSVGSSAPRAPPAPPPPPAAAPAAPITSGDRQKDILEARMELAALREACSMLKQMDVDKAMLESVVARLEQVTARLESLEGKGGAAAPAAAPAAPAAASTSGGGTSPALAAFDTLLSDHLAPLVAKAGELGGDYSEITTMLQTAFKEERTVVEAFSKCKKPAPEQLQKLVAKTGEAAGALHTKADGRRNDAFNHYKTCAEASSALFWVAYTDPSCGMSMPMAHVDESWQSADFYANKILREWKGKDDKHVEWVKLVKALFMELKAYVKAHHTTGPSWNAGGIDLASFSGGGAPAAPAPPPPPSGGPPAPPPPPPPGSLTAPKPAAAKGGAAGMSAVFNQLNQGEAVTSGLKKVTDDMKSKNRADRSGAVPASTSKAAAPAAAPAAKKPPKCVLENGRKWVIENQVENKTIVIDDCNTRQTVYIYNCSKSVIQIKGKVNSISMDKCVRTALVFEDVVAACEAVNSQSVEIQCNKYVPTIVLDKVDGCQVYLSETSKNAAITTAKCSEINILTPGATPDADMVETPLPEQFQSEYKDGKWTTVPVHHSAG